MGRTMPVLAAGSVGNWFVMVPAALVATSAPAVWLAVAAGHLAEAGAALMGIGVSV